MRFHQFPSPATTPFCLFFQQKQQLFVPLFALVALLLTATKSCWANDLQPCPENPIVLEAKSSAQYIFSPYDENRHYPPNTDCQFLLKASSPNHRIHIAVIESELEEPLFSECNDFIGVWDGNDNSSKEVARWCGVHHPNYLTSADTLMLVRFHSDSVVQKRGFNFSFMEFPIPGCPPEWIKDPSNTYCYKQFVLPYFLPWLDAQRECNYERANLLTFNDDSEYKFVYKNFSATHSYPWIGYSDTGTEGLFESVERGPVYPIPFPLDQAIDFKDCVFMDWTKREHYSYEIDDCRNRKAYICKRKTDGLTIPFAMAARVVRRGFVQSEAGSILIIVIIVLVMLLLIAAIIGCVLYYKCKERTNARVSAIDLNHKFVQGIDGGKSELSMHKAVPPPKPQRDYTAAPIASSQHHQRGGRSTTVSPAPHHPHQHQYQINVSHRDDDASVTQLETLSIGAFEQQQQKHQKDRRGATAASNAAALLSSDSDALPLNRRSAAYYQAEAPDEFGMGGIGHGGTGGEGEADGTTGSPRLKLTPNQPEAIGKYGRHATNGAAKTQQFHQRYAAASFEDQKSQRGYEPDDSDGTGSMRVEPGRRIHRLVAVSVESEEQRDGGGEEEKSSGYDKFGDGKSRRDSAGAGTQFSVKKSTRPSAHFRETGAEIGGGIQREGTLFTTQSTMGGRSSGTTSKRLRERRKSFDRAPNVSALDSVSAISLDEFWQR